MTQLLDVHRLFFTKFSTSLKGEVGLTAPSAATAAYKACKTTTTLNISIDPDLMANLGPIISADSSSIKAFGHAHVGENNPLLNIRAFYATMLCSSWPVACEVEVFKFIIRNISFSSSLVATTTATAAAAAVVPMSITEGAVDMREMECLVLFEIIGGMGVSLIMCLAWLVMVAREYDPEGSKSRAIMRRLIGTRLQRINKAIKRQAQDKRVQVEAKINSFIDSPKFRVE
ncbi:hypothetical protein BX616_008644 [Lobosporangium transversale]|nr:hypothetical protein BX616_008644 [Lobosporangium transversale]